MAENHHTDWKAAFFKRLAGPAALFLIVVLFNWKLVLTNQYTWMEGPDMAYLDLPWFQFQAGEWHHGRFPLWDPNSWFGQPLIGQAQPGAAYPLNWLLFLMPLRHGWLRQAALHWYLVLIRYLAMLAAYVLARDLGRSRPASILAGCVYGLGGYVANTVAPQMVNGAVWTPLVFLYLFRAERGQRPWASSLLSGFFLGFGWLAGHHQMNLFVSIAAAGLWIWLCVREGKFNRMMARLAVGSLGIAVMASAFQTLPIAEYGRRAIRWTGAENPQHFNETVPYTVHEEFALKPVSVLGIFVPNVETKSVPYVGVAAFALALLGAILAWRERQVRWLSAIAAGGIFFALGPNSLLHGVIYSLAPLVDKARVPGAGTLLLALGLAPLAAFGADLLPRPESLAWSRRATWTLAVLAGVIATASLVFFAAKISTATDDRLMIPAIAAILAAGVLTGWRAGGLSARAGTWMVIGLVLFELGNVTNYFLPNRSQTAQNPYLHRLAEHSDLADYIRHRGVAARVEYDDQEIPYNIGDWYGLEAVNAYTASVLDNVWKMDVFSPHAKDFFGVRYYLGKTAPRPGLVDVFTGRSGVKVFENPTAFPRVWSVPVAACPDSSGSDDVEMPVHQPNYVRITADLKCRGTVILTDSWFPGWRATVDGKSAKINQAYGGVRGVTADAGEHVIEMRYRPMSVFVGGALSVLAALMVIAVGIMDR